MCPFPGVPTGGPRGHTAQEGLTLAREPLEASWKTGSGYSFLKAVVLLGALVTC